MVTCRYLHQQWDKKAGAKKRTGEILGEEFTTVTKKARLEAIPDTSNTTNTASATSGAATPAEGSARNSASGQEPGGLPPAYPGTSQQPSNRFANQQWNSYFGILWNWSNKFGVRMLLKNDLCREGARYGAGPPLRGGKAPLQPLNPQTSSLKPLDLTSPYSSWNLPLYWACETEWSDRPFVWAFL